ncbi:hypothetical protein NC653_012544 [Populus alba x Populus x berolinensis]|uniref:Uncharacterized protein n=1 Tax=Populus alba x Populus x berolinensis TaxID=444605 RepID=A0AAD6W1Z1_9ROSI|nr:hypothetical protein NC653_012544 [Populus alba x Populus x berolinensis]
MFVSDTGLNISKEDDDIQDQAENRPHLTSTNNHCIKKKKNKFMVTNKKKKKKKKEDVSVRESYSTSDHRLSGGDGGGGGNIDFNKPTKVLFFPFNNPNKFFYKKSSPFSPSPSSSSTAAVSDNACFPGCKFQAQLLVKARELQKDIDIKRAWLRAFWSSAILEELSNIFALLSKGTSFFLDDIQHESCWLATYT